MRKIYDYNEIQNQLFEKGWVCPDCGGEEYELPLNGYFNGSYSVMCCKCRKYKPLKAYEYSDDGERVMVAPLRHGRKIAASVMKKLIKDDPIAPDDIIEGIAEDKLKLVYVRHLYAASNVDETVEYYEMEKTSSGIDYIMEESYENYERRVYATEDRNRNVMSQAISMSDRCAKNNILKKVTIHSEFALQPYTKTDLKQFEIDWGNRTEQVNKEASDSLNAIYAEKKKGIRIAKRKINKNWYQDVLIPVWRYDFICNGKPSYIDYNDTCDWCAGNYPVDEKKRTKNIFLLAAGVILLLLALKSCHFL